MGSWRKEDPWDRRSRVLVEVGRQGLDTGYRPGRVPQLPGAGWGPQPRAGLPTHGYRPGEHRTVLGGWACAAREKVTRGDAPPPPFVPRAGGRAAASGPRGGCAWPQVRTRPPPPPVPGAELAGDPRSPTRARNPARGPAAAAPMPGAGERLQRVTGSERKRPPTRGRGGGGGESRRRATRRAGSRGRPVRRWRASSRSPGSRVSRPFAAETRPALARWPLAALPRPRRSLVRERHEIPNSWRAGGARGHPVGEEAPGRVWERQGDVGNSQES